MRSASPPTLNAAVPDASTVFTVRDSSVTPAAKQSSGFDDEFDDEIDASSFAAAARSPSSRT